MIDKESERALFEANELRDQATSRRDLSRFSDQSRYAGQYHFSGREDRWQGWLAAKADTVVVTEEMVERAAAALFANDWPKDEWKRIGSGSAARRYREGTQKALTAALNGEGK